MTLAAPRPRQTARLPRWLVGISIMAALLGTLAGKVATTTHADKHSEADLIRECLERTGAIKILQDPKRPTVRVFCVELPPCNGVQQWGIMIAEILNKPWADYIERTCFMPGKRAHKGTVEACDGYCNKNGWEPVEVIK